MTAFEGVLSFIVLSVLFDTLLFGVLLWALGPAHPRRDHDDADPKE